MSEEVTLANCPIGLFLSEGGELCLKTEYGNNDGRIDAYIVSSGEFFWGAAPQTIVSQRAQMVTPVENVALRKRPVAFRFPDFADRWVILQDEEAAQIEADRRGVNYEGLYVRDLPGAGA
jgi:hypothetical protein